MPFAGLRPDRSRPAQHWVDIDNRGAVIAAVEHVLANGFTRPSYLAIRSESSWDAERAAGYLAGLAGSGLPADMLFVDRASARAKVRSLLTVRRGGRPDAIVTGSDRLAAVVYGVAADLRLRIGHDLAVTGFDGSDAADLMHPRLTSVAIPVDEIARRVVARALDQVDHGPDMRPGEIVPARLRVGESTGQVAVAKWKRFHPSTASPALAAPSARRVTIADVAADAGVGVGTVSRVLNGGEQVRASTIRTVQDSIGRLGYRPSHAAAALSAARRGP